MRNRELLEPEAAVGRHALKPAAGFGTVEARNDLKGHLQRGPDLVVEFAAADQHRAAEMAEMHVAAAAAHRRKQLRTRKVLGFLQPGQVIREAAARLLAEALLPGGAEQLGAGAPGIDENHRPHESAPAGHERSAGGVGHGRIAAVVGTARPPAEIEAEPGQLQILVLRIFGVVQRGEHIDVPPLHRDALRRIEAVALPVERVEETAVLPVDGAFRPERGDAVQQFIFIAADDLIIVMHISFIRN